MVAAMSKNLRIPEGRSPATRLESRPTPASSCMEPPLYERTSLRETACRLVAAACMPATTSERLDVPFVGQLAIGQLERLPIGRLHPKALFAGAAPACQDLC